MNNNFITWIMSVLIIGMIGCLIVFGIDAFSKVGIQKNDNNFQNIEDTIAIIETKEDLSTPQVVERPIDDVQESTIPDVTYQSSSSKTHFFYSQLDNYAKKIFDGLESNIDNMKTGEYTIEYGDAFSDLLSQENGQKALGDYYQSAIEAFTYDNPEVFFLDPKEMYLNIKKTTKGKKVTYSVCISNSEGSNYLAKSFYSAEQVNECQAQIEQMKNRVLANISGNTQNKIKQIHDYLVDNISYDQTISKENIYNLYGALVNNECVCEGYAKAFKYLLDESGIDNVIVIGTGTNSRGETENHAWNYVAIDGNWYAVDTTWDDPIIQGWGINIPSTYKYRYFLKGSETMKQDHNPNGQFTEGGKVFVYPNISNSDY